MDQQIEKAYQGLLAKVKPATPNFNEEVLRKAFDFAVLKHGVQQRASGDPYFLHPVEVAEIMTELRLDMDSIVTALLHDTVEDTDATLDDIEKLFGKSVRNLVDGVTKLTKIEFQPDNIRQAENFRKLLIAISEDIRVLLIKLADRLHNMRTLHFITKPEKRTRIAYETLEIYAPLAERIGMQKVKDELQDLCFSILYPEAHQSIVSRLSYLRETGKVVVDKIVENLTEVLKENGIAAQVMGREKSPYSIWRKMEKKNVSFEQLADIMAFRIITDNIGECYQVLGIIHSTFHMVPDSFKDFISTPKENGYRSLHTVVIGIEQHRIEIQIRTREMHEIAELGVAAHWSYKQSRDYSTDGKEYRWIREMLYVIEHASGPEEYLENTKLAMYHDQVFCFTPKGSLIALPNGATPVDFAYAVHSDVGNTTVGAKVNGRIVPLRTKLNNGDQVEIIRSKTQTPSPTWEKFVVSAKARSEIRRFVRSQQRAEYIDLGRAILTKAFQQEGGELHDKDLEPLLKIFEKKNTDDIYAAIGEGLIPKNDIIRVVFPDRVQPNQPKKKSLLSRLKSSKKDEIPDGQINGVASPKTVNRLPIKGLIPGMAVHFAGCCHPLPGDKIVGIVNTGKGVTIHTTDCETLHDFTDAPERWLNVSWEEQPQDQIYIGRVKAVLSNEAGSLGTLANTVAKDMGNISNLKIIHRAADFFEIIIDVEVRDISHLSTVMASLRAKPSIYSVERYTV